MFEVCFNLSLKSKSIKTRSKWNHLKSSFSSSSSSSSSLVIAIVMTILQQRRHILSTYWFVDSQEGNLEQPINLIFGLWKKTYAGPRRTSKHHTHRHTGQPGDQTQDLLPVTWQVSYNRSHKFFASRKAWRSVTAQVSENRENVAFLEKQ